MATATAAPPSNPLRTVLKSLGGFADKATLRGKALNKAETVLTDAFGRLSNSDAYLRFAGKAMERSFILTAQTNKAVERTLKAARIPSATTLHEVHAMASGLDEKLDALSCQMEMLMDRLDTIEARLGALEAGPVAMVTPEAPARKSARRKGGEA